ncbi:MAG: glycosyltransferase family 4 protein [Acidimicrobiales bacterium]
MASAPVDRPLRVLISAESFLPAVNGVTNSVLRVLGHLTAAGHEVLVVSPGPGPDVVEVGGHEVEVARVRGVRLPRYGTITVGMPAHRHVCRLLRRFHPDVVHLAAPVALGRSVLAAADELDVPTVAVFQTDLSGFVTAYGLRVASGPVWAWLRRIHNRAGLTLAPTPTVAATLRRHGFERVAVWGRGVDHHQFHPGRRDPTFRARCGAAGDRALIGYVGRLAAEKRVDRLAGIVAGDDTALVVVGDGPARPRLESLLPAATFTGHLSGADLGRAMASLDVFVHTGAHETFCQTIQEAMAAGVSVVAPAIGGPVDLVSHDVDGLLYDPDRAGNLAGCVAALVADRQRRIRLAAAGRRRVAGRTWEALGEELLAHYASLVAGRERSRRPAVGRAA